MTDLSVQAQELICKRFEQEGEDLLQEMVRLFAEKLMGLEADALCGAGYGELELLREVQQAEDQLAEGQGVSHEQARERLLARYGE